MNQALNKDIRLTQAFELIDKGQIKVLSLDIFDTLLWRKVPIPADVFLLLGVQYNDTGLLIEAVPSEKFVELRVKAEYLARHRKCQMQDTEFAEVTLKEIYWQLSGIFRKISIEEMIQGKKGIINESDVDDLVAMEIALENQLLVFDKDLVNLIQYAVQKNIKVILVSDTYFEHSQITQFLSNKPPFQSTEFLPLIHEIYLSCEYGCGKRYGLFDRILKDLQVLPAEMLHIGDNYVSDCLGAAQEGIATLHYPKYEDTFKEVIDREWPTHDLRNRRNSLSPQQGDFGLSSLRAKIAFHTDLSKLTPRDAFFWKYGAMILGPVLMGFVHHIYDRCRTLGQHQVLCLMREGQLYADLIQEFAPYYPQFVLKPHKVWISRRFITHACIKFGEINEFLIMMNVHPASRYTVESFCTFLGLNVDNIPKLKKWRFVKLDDISLSDQVAKTLRDDIALRDEVLKSAKDKRNRFIKYLSTMVDLKSIDKLILVDVGWAGTLQGAIKGVLSLEGYHINLHGLYLGTTEKPDQALLEGSVFEGYLMKAGYPPGTLNTVRRGWYTLEQTAVADLGPLLDIDEHQNIIVGKSNATEAQKHQAHIVQQGIKAFCHQFGQHIQSGAITWNSQCDALTEQLRQILIRGTSYPTLEEAQRFEAWSHDHVSLSGTVDYVLGKNAYYEKFVTDMIPQIAFEDWGMTWPYAYAAKKSKFLALAEQAARLRLIPNECFLSVDAISLNIFLDVGNGFPKKPKERLELHSNPNRGFYGFTKLISIRKAIRGLRLEANFKSAIVSIKSLRLTVAHKNSSKVDLFAFFESDREETKVDLDPVPSINGSTFFCEDGLKLQHMFEDDDVYSVQVNVCFEALFFP